MSARTVFVVEDSKDALAVLTVLLQRRGYNVLSAMDVAQGIAVGTDSAFDLLLCDIGLPDGDGTEVLSALRRDGDFPAIALTAHSTSADIARHLAAGFDLHITKPYVFTDLEKAMNRLLQPSSV